MGDDWPYGNNTMRVPAFLVTEHNAAYLAEWKLAHPDWFLAGTWEQGPRIAGTAPGGAAPISRLPRPSLADRPADQAVLPGPPPTRRSMGRWGRLRPDYSGGVRTGREAVDRRGMDDAEAEALFLRVGKSEGLKVIIDSMVRNFGHGSAAPIPVHPARPSPRPPAAAGRGREPVADVPPATGTPPIERPQPGAVPSEPSLSGPRPQAPHIEPNRSPNADEQSADTDPATPAQRSRLRQNMIRAGQLEDCDPRQGHHIVPQGGPMNGGRDPSAAQQILRQFGIDLESPDNGVGLSKGFHARMHTRSYYEAINRRISRATSASDARRMLREIATELELLDQALSATP